MTSCHLCGGGPVDLVAGYERLGRVTSDCKPWPAGGRLAICPRCGVVHNPTDAAWQADCRRIYDAYTMYSQTDGAEQVVFAPGGEPAPRSLRLLERVQAQAGLPARGRLLDVGCGTGAFLSAFQRLLPGWTLAGSDLGDKNRAQVLAIPGVEALYTCPLQDIPATFDVISFSHSLEHIPGPVAVLEGLRPLLRPGGAVLVQLPDYRQNPVDLVVADHASHFSPATLRAVAEAAGFEVAALAADWIPRELTLLARPGARQVPLAARPRAPEPAREAAGWLAAVVEAAAAAAAEGPLGIFGSSVGAAWLFGALGERAACFVDEDPQRAGRSFLGRPILLPAQVPPGARVFLALPTPQAAALRQRLERAGAAFPLLLPPPLPGAG